MGIYKTQKHTRWNSSVTSMKNLIFRNTIVRISNYGKNIYFVRKTYRGLDTNVSIYRSSTLYNQNVKAELTVNVTPKFHIVVFRIIKFNMSLALIFNAYSVICDFLLD
jgi:hypothetical protein